MKKRFFEAISVVLLFFVSPCARASDVPLPRSTPEAQGISSRAILDFVQAADANVNTMHSFMIVRHGKVIAEGWWKPESAQIPHVLHSVGKSFNATAVGLAIHEGKLNLDDHVLKFFSAEAPSNPSENLKAMTVRDLLTMSAGHATEPKEVGGAPSVNQYLVDPVLYKSGAEPQEVSGALSVKQFLSHPVLYKPGTHFLYNTMGSYVLSAIVTKVTGQTVLEYLKPRLFEPLGIDNPRWELSPEGYSQGAHGLWIRTEDMAKFGQLYLQKGKWNGEQLIPLEWVEKATTKQIPNESGSNAKMGMDWRQGYGFQFWRCRHNAFRADGASGQFIVVMPDQDVVIAITADTDPMQGELDAIWDNLLPAFRSEALPSDAVGQEKLKLAIANLIAHPKKRDK